MYTVSPAQGLQKRLGEGVHITTLDGKDAAAAVAAAKNADVAILMIGNHQSEGRDHTISLGEQDALVMAVAAANRRTIVVLASGGPIFMPMPS